LAATLRKAGRYKLAPKALGAGCTCPENKIGIAGVGAFELPVPPRIGFPT